MTKVFRRYDRPTGGEKSNTIQEHMLGPNGLIQSSSGSRDTDLMSGESASIASPQITGWQSASPRVNAGDALNGGTRRMYVPPGRSNLIWQRSKELASLQNIKELTGPSIPQLPNPPPPSLLSQSAQNGDPTCKWPRERWQCGRHIPAILVAARSWRHVLSPRWGALSARGMS